MARILDYTDAVLEELKKIPDVSFSRVDSSAPELKMFCMRTRYGSTDCAQKAAQDLASLFWVRRWPLSIGKVFAWLPDEPPSDPPGDYIPYGRFQTMLRLGNPEC